MTRLTVLYDSSCGFCLSCRRWLEKELQIVALDFVPARSARAAAAFPGISAGNDELVVVSDDGGIYRDASAWLMCLWALESYRTLAIRLASPSLRPFARRAFDLVSRNRRSISRRLGLMPEADLAGELRDVAPASCRIPPPSDRL